MHLDGPLVASWRGEATTRAIEADALVIAEEAYGSLPAQVCRSVVAIPEHIDRAERLGRATVGDLTCRLIAEVLGCVPRDLSPANHRELPPTVGPTREETRAKHRDRLNGLILGHIIIRREARAAPRRAKRRSMLRLHAALNATRERATRPG